MYNRQFTWGNFDAWTLLPWLAPNLKGRLKFVAQLISSFVWQGHAGDVEWTRCWCCNMDCQSTESQGFFYGLPRLPCNHWLCTTWFSLELTNIPLRNSSQFVVKWTLLLFIFSSLYSLIFFFNELYSGLCDTSDLLIGMQQLCWTRWNKASLFKAHGGWGWVKKVGEWEEKTREG